MVKSLLCHSQNNLLKTDDITPPQSSKMMSHPLCVFEALCDPALQDLSSLRPRPSSLVPAAS